jgi:hypothetical protein
MAYSSFSPTANHGDDSRLDRTSSTLRRSLRQESEEVQDITIPLQLFQATGHGGSIRDRGGSLTWSPQPSLPYTADGALNEVARRMTHTSDVLEPESSPLDRDRQDHTRRDTRALTAETTTIPVLSAVDETSLSASQRTLSYEPDAEDVLSTTPKRSRPTTSCQTTPAASIWSTTDPFSTSTSSLPENGAQPTQPSQTPARPLPSSQGDPDNTTPRRGTMQSIFDAVVPDSVQRRLTNASHVRKSSIWQLYEQAKERGVKLQRQRGVQLAFEYGIYAILMLIIYFVLIGLPLWNGAVYWLWWVVAHKFVIAGGFSITLGVALL